MGEIREWVAGAAEARADTVLLLPPYFIIASEPAGNQDFHCSRRRQPTTDLPRHILGFVGSAIDPESVAAMADHESVVGLRDSSGDLTGVDEALANVPAGFRVYQGFDAGLVPATYMGATGGINALSHLLPETMSAAVDAVRPGDHDEARRLQRERIDPLFRFRADYGFAPATKVALAASGVIPSAEVRPPLVLPDVEACAEIEEVAERVGDGGE